MTQAARATPQQQGHAQSYQNRQRRGIVHVVRLGLPERGHRLAQGAPEAGHHGFFAAESAHYFHAGERLLQVDVEQADGLASFTLRVANVNLEKARGQGQRWEQQHDQQGQAWIERYHRHECRD